MLCVAFMWMSLSLNLQGYVHGSDDFDENGVPHAHSDRGLITISQVRHFDSPIHVEAVAQYAHKGAIFDPNQDSYVWPMVPVLIHVVMVLILNTIYGGIAEWLTSLENHRYSC